MMGTGKVQIPGYLNSSTLSNQNNGILQLGSQCIAPYIMPYCFVQELSQLIQTILSIQLMLLLQPWSQTEQVPYGWKTYLQPLNPLWPVTLLTIDQSPCCQWSASCWNCIYPAIKTFLSTMQSLCQMIFT